MCHNNRVFVLAIVGGLYIEGGEMEEAAPLSEFTLSLSRFCLDIHGRRGTHNKYTPVFAQLELYIQLELLN